MLVFHLLDCFSLSSRSGFHTIKLSIILMMEQVSRFITDQLLYRCVLCRSLCIKVRAFG